jgi:hypothetical protein
MSIDELIRLMEARLAALNSARASAAQAGDIAQITRLDADISQTQTTLDQLRTLI